MPFTIRIEAESGIAIATCSGTLTLPDAREGAEALWKTPGWMGRSAVWDFRSAEFDLSSGDIVEIAQFILNHQPTPPPAKIAFATGRSVDFGVSRMFEVYRRDPQTAFRVFREYDEAIRWARSPDPDLA